MTSAMLSVGAGSTSAVCFPGSAAMSGQCTVPRCEIKVERCEGGCKIYCCCDDEAACKMLQKLCDALAGGVCSMCCTSGGVCVCQCSFTCCRCECQATADGVCITCTSGDGNCRGMVQALCDCIGACQECGCTCTVCFNNTPVCCATC